MKTCDITDDAGRLLGFEISNTWLSRHQAARILARAPGVFITRPVRRPFSMEPALDEFCAFRLGDVECFLWEPFGDNSRYYIGTRAKNAGDELALTREAFTRVPPPCARCPASFASRTRRYSFKSCLRRSPSGSAPCTRVIVGARPPNAGSS